jgi:Phage capsid family
VSFDETESEDDGGGAEEDESSERPYGARPYGARPYGARPYGARPYGARPYGARPYGARPYGARPYGARPYGARPYGARPYGARPGAGRGGERLDPEEWSADLTSLVCEYSAVIRLGATIVSGGYELRVPSGVAGQVGERPLRPRANPVDAYVGAPNRIVRDLAANPELAYGLKTDLATGLAAQADQRFLGAMTGEERPAANLLATARALMKAVRKANPAPVFRSPGWILSLRGLQTLTRIRTLDGISESWSRTARTLDSYQLLRLDEADGGMFLGYPFVISLAAPAAIYFAADWREAWVGIDRELVTVDVSSDAAFGADQTVFRASMAYDFALRRPVGFRWAPVP